MTFLCVCFCFLLCRVSSLMILPPSTLFPFVTGGFLLLDGLLFVCLCVFVYIYTYIYTYNYYLLIFFEKLFVAIL